MTPLLLLPAILSLLFLAAHFLRAGSMGMVLAMLALIGLTALRRWWAARILQAVLVLGVLNWIGVAALIALRRQASGAPWVRMAVILGAVALLALAGALLIQTATLRRWFRIGRA